MLEWRKKTPKGPIKDRIVYEKEINKPFLYFTTFWTTAAGQFENRLADVTINRPVEAQGSHLNQKISNQ